MGTLLLLFGVMELRNLNNTLVRTLPALRLLRREVRRLRKVEESESRSGARRVDAVV